MDSGLQSLTAQLPDKLVLLLGVCRLEGVAGVVRRSRLKVKAVEHG